MNCGGTPARWRRTGELSAPAKRRTFRRFSSRLVGCEPAGRLGEHAVAADLVAHAGPWEGTMPTPAQLREASQLYCQAAETEATPEIGRRLASHALALTQL